MADMILAGWTVGDISFNLATSTTIQSSGGFSLTLDDNGSASMIDVAGTHTIVVPVILNNDLDITGTGTLTLSGGVSGPYTLDIGSGGDVTAKSIQVGSLLIGSGGKLTIQATSGFTLSGALTPVPEPGNLILLITAAVGLPAIIWRRK